MLSEKNAMANAQITPRDSQSSVVKDAPSAVALTTSLTWVRGMTYRIHWKKSGSLSVLKKVPHRKVIGSMTSELNSAMLWCDFARSAAVSPRQANVKHASQTTRKN